MKIISGNTKQCSTNTIIKIYSGIMQLLSSAYNLIQQGFQLASPVSSIHTSSSINGGLSKKVKGPVNVERKPAKLAPLQPVEKNFGSTVIFDPSYWFIVINWGQRGIQDGHLARHGKAPWDSNRQSAPLHQFPDDRSECWKRKVENEGVNEQTNKTRSEGGGDGAWGNEEDPSGAAS